MMLVANLLWFQKLVYKEIQEIHRRRCEDPLFPPSPSPLFLSPSSPLSFSFYPINSLGRCFLFLATPHFFISWTLLPWPNVGAMETSSSHIPSWLLVLLS